MMKIEGKHDGIDDGQPTASRGWALERGFPPFSPIRGAPPFITLARAMALVVVAAFFALSMAVHANGAWQGQSDQAQAYLPPESTCKDFVAAETIVWSANRYWLNGFLSAYNMLSHGSGNVGGSAGYEAMIQWLVDRCTDEPTLSFLDATAALIRALEQRNP